MFSLGFNPFRFVIIYMTIWSALLFICLKFNQIVRYLICKKYNQELLKNWGKQTYPVARQALCHTDRACAACRTRECTGHNSSWTKCTPIEISNSQSYFSQSERQDIYPRHPRVLSLFQMKCRTTVHIPL